MFLLCSSGGVGGRGYVNGVDMMWRKFYCRWLGHNPRWVGSFHGGSSWICRNCHREGSSFEKCPSEAGKVMTISWRA